MLISSNIRILISNWPRTRKFSQLYRQRKEDSYFWFFSLWSRVGHGLRPTPTLTLGLTLTLTLTIKQHSLIKRRLRSRPRSRSRSRVLLTTLYGWKQNEAAVPRRLFLKKTRPKNFTLNFVLLLVFFFWSLKLSNNFSNWRQFFIKSLSSYWW